jgi:hypothetical protein
MRILLCRFRHMCAIVQIAQGLRPAFLSLQIVIRYLQQSEAVPGRRATVSVNDIPPSSVAETPKNAVAADTCALARLMAKER